MIVFPIFAEQDYNAERLHRTGRGIRLELRSLTLSQLEDAISRLLTDTSFKQQMKLASMRFVDRPAKPLETAMWWVDYIMRHEDTSFLRPLAISLTWYQRRQLDVWGFLAVSSLAVFYICGKILAKILAMCCGRGQKATTKASKSKKHN